MTATLRADRIKYDRSKGTYDRVVVTHSLSSQLHTCSHSHSTHFKLLLTSSTPSLTLLLGSKSRGETGEAYVLMCGDGGNDVGALKQVS